MVREREAPGSDPARHRRIALAAPCVALLVVLLYVPVVGHDFVNFDDDRYVTENPVVRRGLTAEGVAWAFTSFHASNWHPLTWLSHMLDVELYGLDPGGHHATSVLLHAVNAALLLLVLGRLTRRFWPGLLVALLFALHPLRVESVAWVAERKDVLAALFWMLGLLAYASWVEHGGRARYAWLLVCFALGLLAKPMVVTLPFVLLLLDFWPLQRMQRGLRGRLVLEKAPLFVLSVASIAITLVAQQGGGAMQASETWGLGARLSNALVACVAYLGKTVWPAGLACFYPHPAAVGGGGAAVTAGAGLLLAGATVLAFVTVRRRPYVAFGWLWYLGTLVPVIGIVQVGSQAMADRYTYLPSIGILVAVAWALADWTGRQPRRSVVVVPAAAAALAALAAATWVQIGTWRDGRTLFEHALRVTRDNYVAHANLGSVLESRGELAAAAREFERALGIRDDFAPAHGNLGLVRMKQGDLAAAVAHLERAVRLDSGNPEPHANLGAALHGRGDLLRATEHLERALRLDPAHARAHNNLGLVLEALGDPDGASARYERALEIEPGFAEAHVNLGNVLLARGDTEGARSHYESALRFRPELAEAHNNLAVVLAREGDHRGAVHHYRRAAELRPGLIGATAGLAWLLATSADPSVRDGEEAFAHATRCVEATGERDPACLEALAAAHAELGEFERAVRWQTRAVSLVAPAAAAPLRARLALYRSATPHRE